MSELDANVLQNGQRSIATVVMSGNVVENTGELDATCVINTEQGRQKVVKAYLVGIAGNAGLVTVVPTLPETGVEGKFYGVMMDETTKDGYAIIQFFIWYDNQWCAAGAFDVYIDPDNLVYKSNFTFDAASNTLTLDLA